MTQHLDEFHRYSVQLFEKQPEDTAPVGCAYFHIYTDGLAEAINDMRPLIGRNQWIELNEVTEEGPLLAAILYADPRLVPPEAVSEGIAKEAA